MNKKIMNSKNLSKKNRYIVIFFIGLIIACLVPFTNPRIKITARIQSAQESESRTISKYEKISSSNSSLDDYRFLLMDFKISKPLIFIHDLSIERESFEQYFTGYQLERTIYSSAKKTDNEIFPDSFQSISNGYYFIDGVKLSMKDMTEEKLEDIFGDYKIVVTWVDLFRKSHQRVYYLKEFL